MRAGAYAYAKRRQRKEELMLGNIESDDENYVRPESRNYLCSALFDFSLKF